MDRNSEKLELNKILAAAAEYACSAGGREKVLSLTPSGDLKEVRARLAYTAECDKLLYLYGVGKIEEFTDMSAALGRAKKGSVLSCAELRETARLLHAVRAAYTSISKVDDESLTYAKAAANKLIFDKNLEDDISDKILSDDAVSDNASSRLFSIRSKIKNLNEKIKAQLAEYVSGKNAEYLRDAIVTMRNDRYVIPVKAEHKNHIKGFIHDRSKTGATFFIEPEYVLELNNELIALTIDEKEEIEVILKELSVRAGAMAGELSQDAEILSELDAKFALAEYAYAHKCVMPEMNDRGVINIVKGRHPLIDREKVVPVSVSLGKDYAFLLLSGANTGGKTVTLKMCGLFTLMAECGLFVPAAAGSELSVFGEVFCDIGDSQSIEESLSTFSSHLENIIKICTAASDKSLILIDELGGGTNPDEGQAIAKAVLKFLLGRGCKGIVTTHFTPLKEYAYVTQGVENASMEFDAATYKPLYSINIGLPGTSNALAIARHLGMDEEILNDAMGFLSEGAQNFENIVRRAEESRVKAEKVLREAENIKAELTKKLSEAERTVAELNKEREKIARGARVESRRIIGERTERAEELLAEMEEIFKTRDLSEADLIRARTIKNKLGDIAYDEEGEKSVPNDFEPATADNLKVGAQVFVVPMETRGVVTAYSSGKKEAEIACGSLKMHIGLKDLRLIGEAERQESKVKVVKTIPKEQPMLEINLLGMTVGEALYEVDNFIDKAVTDNLEEIKIIHGVGTGKLKNAIHEHLKRHKNVASFRLGKYGEGETGVTFIKLR